MRGDLLPTDARGRRSVIAARRPLALVVSSLALATPGSRSESMPVSFVRDIAPVLVERCIRCHDEESAKGGYRADSFERLGQSGESGFRPVAAGDPRGSYLFDLLTTPDAETRMPRKGEALDVRIVDSFRNWIAEGAKFDGTDPRQPLVEIAGPGNGEPAPARYAHPVPVRALAWLSGNRLAIGGIREVIFWSTGGTLEKRQPGTPERLHGLTELAGAPLGGRGLLFAGGVPGRSGVVGFLPLATNQPARIFHRAADTVLALAASPDGSLVAVGGTERGIALYDLARFERVGILAGHSDWVLDLAFSRDGSKLASASRDRTARVFEIRDRSLVAAFRGHKGAVTSVAFLDGTNRVVSGSREGRLRAWDCVSGKEIRASEAIGAEVHRILVDGEVIRSVWSDGGLREHRADDLKPVREWGLGGDPALGLTVSPETGAVAISRHSGRVEIWDPRKGVVSSAFAAAP